MKSFLPPIMPLDFGLDECIARNRAAADRFTAKLQALVEAAGPRLDIMLVGGDELRQVQTYLQQELKAEIRYTSTAREALELFYQDHADLVVVDVRIKDLALPTLLKELRTEAGEDHFASIVVTSDAKSAPQDQAAIGADSSILRPLLIKEFVSVVKQLYKLPDTGAFRALVGQLE